MFRPYAFLLCLLPLTAAGQNPIISGQFTADPTARVFDGRLWLFPSHDIISPTEPGRRWFSMADYHAYCSSDLTDWSDHGVILSQTDVPWGDPQGYSMWAPDCIEKDGKYYLFYHHNDYSPAFDKLRSTRIDSLFFRPDGTIRPVRATLRGVGISDFCARFIGADGQPITQITNP